MGRNAKSRIELSDKRNNKINGSSIKSGPRWWPVVLIIVLFGGYCIWDWVLGLGEQSSWNPQSTSPQDGIRMAVRPEEPIAPVRLGREGQVMRTLEVLRWVGIALVIWLVLLSRISLRARAKVLGALALVVAAMFLILQQRGTSGDMVPIFEWRWSEIREVVGDKAGGQPFFEYPQFLGTGRDGKVHDVKLARDWEASPPVLLWRRKVGAGWSGFAVSAGHAVTQDQVGDRERVVALNVTSGECIWEHFDTAHYRSRASGEGPRATPAIDADRVYTIGGTGIVNALDLETGVRLWSRDLQADFGATLPGWGYSSSPLVYNGKLIVASGVEDALLVALDLNTGEILWKRGQGRLAYSSPTVVTLMGIPQIVLFHASKVTGHDIHDGHVLWQLGCPDRCNVTLPVQIGEDRIMFSAGYGIGTKLYQVSRSATGAWRTERCWNSVRLKSKFAANLIVTGDFVYGLDDGVLVCLDTSTGERIWKGDRYGHGQLLLVDDLLLVQCESGEIALLDVTPEKPRELSRFRALDSRVWNAPALSGPYLLVRNDVEAALFELPLSR